MAEIEFSVLSRSCLKQRLPDEETLHREVQALVKERNAAQATIQWRFKTQDARWSMKVIIRYWMGVAGVVTDQQVVLLRQRRMERKARQTSAAMAGMSVRSVRKWQCVPLPSETGQERWWWTRTSPFDGVWGRRRPCRCSRERPPAGSGQRQLSSGWKRNSPAASAPPNSAPCNDDYRTGELSMVRTRRSTSPRLNKLMRVPPGGWAPPAAEQNRGPASCVPSWGGPAGWL